MEAFRSEKAAEYRQQAKRIRTPEAGIPLLEAKFHLFEAARHLEEMAADEERQRASLTSMGSCCPYATSQAVR